SVLAFLFPLAIYCWILGVLNRRPRPTLVSGVWDCAGLLFAASGLLLVVGPAIVYTLYDKSLHDVPAEQDAAEIFEDLFQKTRVIWAIYLALVLSGAGLLLWSRRDKTVIYNVDPELFPHVLGEALQGLGLEQARMGSGLHLAVLPRRSRLGADAADGIVA